ncbi:MAG: folylpolyglutamate synthase/dihydrofolate synthase family protein [Chitinophagaceae bacterium]
MTYQQTINYLFKKLPMYSRIGSSAFKKDLTNIKLLCRHLNDPHKKFKSIHVGGTNGKGSVSHMLAAILQTSGYKTGLYTSPHLYDFKERIKINSEMVNEDFVIDFVGRITPLIEEIKPSFFEITVAMAFEYFAQQGVDVAVIEVGLGGRLDSTNIIKPEVSVITNISKDHVDMLGNTLKEIAFEKAGIIKEDIPVVIGQKQVETDDVFNQVATSVHSPLFYAEENYAIKSLALNDDLLTATVHDMHVHSDSTFDLDLTGTYQLKNLITVLQAVELLRAKGYKLEINAVKQALKTTKKITGLYGRWEVVRRMPMIVLEVAHNADGIREMLQHLHHIRFKNLHIVFGMVRDKDPDEILKLLPADAGYYFTQANIPRALHAEILHGNALKYHLQGTTYKNVNAALKQALDNAALDDLIIVCGSIFLVAEVDKQLFGEVD